MIHHHFKLHMYKPHPSLVQYSLLSYCPSHSYFPCNLLIHPSFKGPLSNLSASELFLSLKYFLDLFISSNSDYQHPSPDSSNITPGSCHHICEMPSVADAASCLFSTCSPLLSIIIRAAVIWGKGLQYSQVKIPPLLSMHLVLLMSISTR